MYLENECIAPGIPAGAEHLCALLHDNFVLADLRVARRLGIVIGKIAQTQYVP